MGQPGRFPNSLGEHGCRAHCPLNGRPMGSLGRRYDRVSNRVNLRLPKECVLQILLHRRRFVGSVANPLRNPRTGHVNGLANLLRFLLFGLTRHHWSKRRSSLWSLGHHHESSEQYRHYSYPQVGQHNTCLDSIRVDYLARVQRSLAGPTSARMIPRTAFTSREDQPDLVKIVRRVFLVASVRDAGKK